MAIDEPVAQLKLVPTDELEEEREDEDEDHEEGDRDARSQGVKDELMDVDVKGDGDTDTKPFLPPTRLRLPEPDYSWLPPLPSAADLHTRQADAPATAINRSVESANEPNAAPSSIADRYKSRIPFGSSSLKQHSVYQTPAPPTTRRTQVANANSTTNTTTTSGPTSLPSLIQTYADTRNELSVAIRPNGYRLQALDLLRRQIASPDGFTPSDSLSLPHAVPGPQVTPIAVPAHAVTIDPSQQGIMSQLVHSIHSANLPPELRERLTSLRPPLAQKKDGLHVHYGPRIRGADEAALLRAKGQQPEARDELPFQASWDSGPRGLDKFSRGYLPKGKKVIKHVEGDEFPRQEKRKSIDAGAGAGAGAGGSAGAGSRTTLRLKLGEHASISPGAAPSLPPTPGGTGSGSGTTIRLRLTGSHTPSASPGPSPSAPPHVPLPPVEPTLPPVYPVPKLEPDSVETSGLGMSDAAPPRVTEKDFAQAIPPPPSASVQPNGEQSSITPNDTETLDRKPSPAALQAASLPAPSVGTDGREASDPVGPTPSIDPPPPESDNGPA